MAKQVEESLAILEELKKKTSEEVTSFRIKSDATEDARRRLEEERRLRRFDSIEVDAIQCGRKQAKIELSWQDIMQINVPQDLHAALEQQKAECHSVVAKKDRKIIEFNSDLREKDEEFVKSINENNKDVKALIESMHTQYQTMRSSYKAQLQEVEQAHEKERKTMLDSQKEKIKSLFAVRNAKEEHDYMNARKERLVEFRTALAESRARDLDQFSRVKLQHELAIQDLEQHWARMNSTYHLNREKLDYNSQILAERHKEFQSIISSYRNRIQRLRNALSSCVATYKDQQTTLKNANMKITGEYKRLTRQVKDLQKKLADFSSVAEKQFREAWEMHVANVDQIIYKVYEADKVICEQQLCLPWEPPLLRLEKERYETGDGLSEFGAGSAHGARSTVRGSDHAKGTNASSSRGGAGGASKVGESGDAHPHARFVSGKYRAIMQMVLGEVSFLLDSQVLEELSKLDANDAEGAFIKKGEALEAYLGIDADSTEDRDLLISFFTQGTDDEDDEIQCEPEESLTKLKSFLQRKSELRLAHVAPTASSKRRGRKGSKDNQNSNATNSNDEAVKRELERRWWQEKSKVLPDVTLRVWSALDKNLQKYFRLLEERANVLESNVALKTQNDQLMLLIDQYVHSRVNEELKVPPKHVIKVV